MALTASPFEHFVQILEARTGPRPADRGNWRCPAHEDNQASLAVKEADDGKVLLRCHAGCEATAVVASLGLKLADLMPASQNGTTRNGDHGVRLEFPLGTKTYVYTDEQGQPLYRVVRTPPKNFFQQHWDGKAWVKGLPPNIRRVPYKLPELLAAARAKKTAAVVEGERDADTALANGFVATCNVGGAGNGKWREDYARYFKGCSAVYVVADQDDAGRAHADQVAASVGQVVQRTFIVDPKAGKDLSDHVAAGFTLAELFVDPSGFKRSLIGDLIRKGIPAPQMTHPWLYASALAVLQAEPGGSKAQPLDAKVLTPTGWRLMGELAVGDEVITVDGSATTVTGIYPQGVRPAFRITMTDGASTVASGDHLWVTRSHNNRVRNQPGCVRTTEEIQQVLIERGSGNRMLHQPVLQRAVQFDDHGTLPIDPYVLGVLLGDGCFRGSSVTLSNPEAQITKEMGQRLPPGGLRHDRGIQWSLPLGTLDREQWCKTHLMRFDLWGKYSYEKHIPEVYLRASAADRLDLLRGLVDTDGWVTRSGSIRFDTSSPQLADDVTDLVNGLGGIVRRTGTKAPKFTYRGEQRVGRPSYSLSLCMPRGVIPATLSAKVERMRPAQDRRIEPDRQIVSVEPAGVAEMQCISVAHPSHLYVTDGYIVTHNTWVALRWAQEMLETGEWSVMYLDEEGGEDLVAERFAALGCDPALIDRHFHYFPFPGRKWTATDLASLRDTMQKATDKMPLGLVVMDSLPDFLALAGLSEDSAKDVTEFVDRLLAVTREFESTLLVLDHLPKPDNEDPKAKKRRSRYSRGSGAKLAKADLTFLLETADEFSRHKSGKLNLWAAKDRRGFLSLPRIHEPPHGLDVIVDPRTGSVKFEGGVQMWVPTRCRGHILDVLDRYRDEGLTINQIEVELNAAGHDYRSATIDEAVRNMQTASLLVRSTNGLRLPDGLDIEAEKQRMTKRMPMGEAPPEWW